MSEVFMNRVFPPMRSAFPKEWEDALQRALDLKAHRYIPGHGFVDGPERSREEMQAFRAAITHIRSEARRLHGPSPDDRPDWGEYASWMLAASQGPIALQRHSALRACGPRPRQEQRPVGKDADSSVNYRWRPHP